MTQNSGRKSVEHTSGLTRCGISAVLAIAMIAGTTSCYAQSSDPSQFGSAGLNNWSENANRSSNQAASQPVNQSQNPPAGPEAQSGSVSIDDNLIVELHVKDEDLSNVLQMLSIQSQKNIVASQSVSATVTANLYGVTFYEALDSILHANGFGYVEKGNFIYIYTLEEIIKIEEATRLRVAKVIKLNYLNAIDAAEFVKPLLSDGGQIKSNGRAAAFNIPENSPVGGEDYANESALVLYDYPENVSEIEKLIQALDTRPAQILIEATILQTALSEGNAFGVDFGVIGDMNFTDFVSLGGPLRAVEGLITGQGGVLNNGSTTAVNVPNTRDGNGSGITSNVANINGPSTFKGGIVDGNVAVFLRLLDEVTDTTILSRPKLLTLNRQPARVLVGRKVGYLSTTATDTSTTQTVEFLDTGTQLYARPFVTTEGTIRMELKPQVSEAVIRDVTDATGAAVTIPDEVTNELVANVMVRDGQTIVLGGLFRESTVATRRQVPFVGDIPIIGAAFRGHEDETDRSEIIFLITPSIVSDAVLANAGARGEAYTEAVRAGSRKGLLPFSRDRLSSSKLLDAERLAAEGDTARAQHKVNQSLRLNPNQPDAIRLRETLNPGGNKDWPTRSMLDDIIGNEAREAARSRSSVSATPTGNTRADQSGTLDVSAEVATQTESGTDWIDPNAWPVSMPNPNSETARNFETQGTTNEFANDEFANSQFADTQFDQAQPGTQPGTQPNFQPSGTDFEQQYTEAFDAPVYDSSEELDLPWWEKLERDNNASDGRSLPDQSSRTQTGTATPSTTPTSTTQPFTTTFAPTTSTTLTTTSTTTFDSTPNAELSMQRIAALRSVMNVLWGSFGGSAPEATDSTFVNVPVNTPSMDK
jgi:type IV pilus secretin PilQ/predicted competence protein